MTDRALDAYYDRLARFTSWARLVGYGGGRSRLTVHRALADPRRGGRPTVTRLHDLLHERIAMLAPSRVLDAGCGLGGTLIDLASRMPGKFSGLTLSPKQAAIAHRAIADSGLAQRVDVSVGNYDHPPDPLFDAIYAVESLAHSPSPRATVAALGARLCAGGTLIVVDDMPKPLAAADADLVAFKRGWRLPELLGADDYPKALESAGLALVEDLDLTSALRPRRPAVIRRLRRLNRAAARLVPSAAARMVLDSYDGGLALESLYRRGRMSYRLLVARRKRD